MKASYCECSTSLDHRVQLLRSRLWPASPIMPQAAATFDLLRLFHVADHRAHVNITDFYAALELLSDGAGTRHIPVSSAFVLVLLILTPSPGPR
jgi:hypothetical protein